MSSEFICILYKPKKIWYTENGNGDGALTLQEWYSYVYQKTYYRQTPRVHPKNCTEVIFRRTAGEQ